jgi:hypothetical protein
MVHVGQKRSWAEDRDDDLLAQLRDGVEGSTVLEGLVQKNGNPYTVASLSTMVSNLRSKFIKNDDHHQRIDRYMSSLALRKFTHLEAKEETMEEDKEEAKEDEKASEAKAVAEFFCLPLAKQLEAQRLDAPGWCKEARDARAALRLLPSNLSTFKLIDGQTASLKQNSAEALERKTSTLIVVTTTDLLLDEARAVIEGANSTTHMPTLTVALLLVSGRRTAEITNGNSIFTEVPGKDYHALFDGQLKQRGTALPYTIPLVVPFKLFLHGYMTLQEMQKHAQLPNEEAKAKYQPMVADAVSKTKNLPGGLTPHDLRTVYAAVINSVFAHQLPIPGLIKRVLGHSSVMESLHYSNVRLDPLPTASLGELPTYD